MLNQFIFILRNVPIACFTNHILIQRSIISARNISKSIYAFTENAATSINEWVTLIWNINVLENSLMNLSKLRWMFGFLSK